MADQYVQPQYTADPTSRIRDLEEKLRLLKDRVLLVGQTLVEEREKNFSEIQDMKSSLIKIKEENTRIKELLERITEQINNLARKEEFMIIQRQLDLLKK